MANARNEECYQYKGDGIWWYTLYVEGKRRRVSTRTTVKKEAEKIRVAAQDGERRAALFGTETTLTFGEACGHYLDAGKPDRFLDRCFARWENTLVRDLKSGVIKAGAMKLYPGASPATWIRQVIAPVCAVINHCHDLGLCPPVKVRRRGDRQWQVAKTLKTAVGRDYIDALIDELQREKPTGRGGQTTSAPHAAALVLFMYTTGFRIGAATSMTIGDHIDLEAATATWGKDKNGEPHSVPLTAEVVAMIASLPREGRNCRKAFLYASARSVYKVLKAAAKNAGLKYVPPHQVGRHSFATELMDAGCTVADIMKFGNWKSAALVLENYAHSKKEHAAAIDRIFGATGTGDPTVTQLAPARRKALRRKAS